MRVDLFDYELPKEQIARFPSPERASARLLVMDPAAFGRESLLDRRVADLSSLLPRGALVVMNDTRVVPARFFGNKRGTGGKVEILLVERIDGGVGEGRGWDDLDGPAARFRALAKASKPLLPGGRLTLGAKGELEATVEAISSGEGLVDLSIRTSDGGPLGLALFACGEVPLPPYLGRAADEHDRERYQTVYARRPGAIAAPTAGLHLSEGLMADLERAGIRTATLTLHVGLGTFKPVTVDDFDKHSAHAEWLEVPVELVGAVDEARANGAPVVALGTTTVRALESAADPERLGHVRAMSGSTRLLIQPGYRFRVVDTLFTNFHLPRSTLIALVAAFAGREQTLVAYRAAVERGYRFFSYGDAMLVTRRGAYEAPPPLSAGPDTGVGLGHGNRGAS